jgi:hypothetical protein
MEALNYPITFNAQNQQGSKQEILHTTECMGFFTSLSG